MLGVDIMPSVNDVLCIIIIPLLDYLVYPHIESSMRIKLRRIHKVLHNHSLLVTHKLILYCVRI